jgi:sugar transferase EpsL
MHKPKTYCLKTALDWTLLIIGVIPIHMLIALIVLIYFIKDQHTIIFRQTRSGLNGEAFTIYKFKTLDDNEMVTSIGKILRRWSLDELPQIWNVMNGDMSFVGPRPLLHEYLASFSVREKQRITVKPGITGLAQIKGRNSINWKSKFQYDIEYVENHSFLLDLKIVLYTMLQWVTLEYGSTEPVAKFTAT